MLSKKLHSGDVDRPLSDTMSAVADGIKMGLVNDFRRLLRFTLTTLKDPTDSEGPTAYLVLSSVERSTCN